MPCPIPQHQNRNTLAKTCIILKGASRKPEPGPDEIVVDFEEVKRWSRSGGILLRLFRWRRVRLMTCRLGAVHKPFLTAALIWLLSHWRCEFADETGAARRVSLWSVLGSFGRMLRDVFAKGRLLREADEEINTLSAEADPAALDLAGTAVHLRTDLTFGVRSGGSVGHIAGVLNSLDAFAADAVFLSTDHVPTVRDDIETHLITPEDAFWDFRELNSLAFNRRFLDAAKEALADRRVALVYQRYSLNNWAGLALARHLGVPFVLEYNGSEIWMARHWGTPLRHEALSERIELMDLNAADLVVVVSRPMQDELVARGVDAGRILVNPNGVDAQVYSPEVDGSAVRRTHGFGDRVVIGFIGTFGPWHGAEVLADAFGRMIAKRPDLRDRARLLMIGDGSTMQQVRGHLARHNVEAEAVLTGLIPQSEGPAHLAACDVLASPHVPNADGTPFFGSPTKLFEYMAVGRGIVASDLDQIGEILEHGRTAWMVEPGNPDALADGLATLIDDRALRERLGAAAREEAVANHTWLEHTRRIIERLRERCGGAP